MGSTLQQEIDALILRIEQQAAEIAAFIAATQRSTQ